MVRRQQISVRRIILALGVLATLLTASIGAEVLSLAQDGRTSQVQFDLSNRFLISKIMIPVAPPITNFDEVTHRTLFAADRGQSSSTPSPSEAKTEAPQQQPTSDPQMTLMGVIIAPGTRLAILQPVAGGTAQKVPLGETVGEWRLTAIYPDHVELKNSEKTDKLYLNDSVSLQGTIGGQSESREEPDTMQ